MFDREFRGWATAIAVAVATFTGCAESSNSGGPSPPKTQGTSPPQLVASPSSAPPDQGFVDATATGPPGAESGGEFPGGFFGSGGAGSGPGSPPGPGFGGPGPAPATERRLLPGEVKHFRGHGGAVTSVAVRAGSKNIYSGGIDRTLRAWDIASGQATGRWEAAEFGLESRLAVCRNAPITATSGHDGSAAQLRIHDFGSGEVRPIPLAASAGFASPLVAPPGSPVQHITGLALSANGKRCFVCDNGGQLFDFDPQAISDGSAPGTGYIGEINVGGTCLALSADGKLLGTGGNLDRNGIAQPIVRIWDTGIRQLQMILTVVSTSVPPRSSPELGPPSGFSPAGGPGGVFGPRDGAGGLGEPPPPLGGPRRPGGSPPSSRPGEGLSFGAHPTLRSIDFAPDAGFAAAGGNEAILYVWPLPESKEGTTPEVTAGRRLVGHEAEITGVAALPDGQHVVSVSRDSTIRFWNVFAGEEVQRLNADGPLLCLALAADGKQLVTGSQTGMVSVWDVPALPKAAVPASLPSPVVKSDTLPGLTALRTAALDQIPLEIPIGGFAAPDLRLQSWVLGTQGPRVLLQHTGGFAIVDARTAKLLRRVEVPLTTELGVFPGRPRGKTKKSARPLWGQIMTATLSADGRQVIAAINDLNSGAAPLYLAAWDADAGTPGKQIDLLPGIFPMKVDASPNGQSVFAGSPGDRAVLWNVAKGTLATRPLTFDWEVVAFNQDCTRFISLVFNAAESSRVEFPASPVAEIWRSTPEQRLKVLKPMTGDIAAAVLLPTGDAVVAEVDANGTSQLLVRSADSGEELRRFTAPARLEAGGRITTLALSPKGDCLASIAVVAEGSHQLQLWDVASGQECFRFGATQPWMHLCFAPDGQSLAAVREDGGMQWTLAAKSGAPAVESAATPPTGTTRLWSDTTGKFKITAEFVEIVDGEVRLRKTTGELVTVPVNKLSQEDQDFLRQATPAKK